MKKINNFIILGSILAGSGVAVAGSNDGVPSISEPTLVTLLSSYLSTNPDAFDKKQVLEAAVPEAHAVLAGERSLFAGYSFSLCGEF